MPNWSGGRRLDKDANPEEEEEGAEAHEDGGHSGDHHLLLQLTGELRRGYLIAVNSFTCLSCGYSIAAIAYPCFLSSGTGTWSWWSFIPKQCCGSKYCTGKLYLDPDPETFPNLDPGPSLLKQLHYRLSIWKKEINIFVLINISTLDFFFKLYKKVTWRKF